MPADDFQPLFAIETKGRHRRRCRRLFVAALLAAWILPSGALSSGNQPHNALDPQTVTDEFVATALEPFWRTTEIREPIFFIERVGADRPQGRLLFKPTEVVSVTSGTRDVKFEPGKDFIVNRAARTISLPPGSSIPVATREYLYPLMTLILSKIARKSGDRTRGIFFDEGSAYHKLQVEVTYHHEPDQ